MSLPWTERYRPKTLEHVVDNIEAIGKLTRWLRGWEKGIPAKRAAFLYGPPGIGKTASSEALANDFGYDFFELNASDFRTAKHIHSLVKQRSAMTTTLLERKRLVIIDEVEGVHKRADMGGLAELVEAVKTTRVPMILIANDYWNKILSRLRSVSIPIKFERPPIPDIVSRLRLICRSEGIRADEERLRRIAEQSGGDLRSAINDLQTLAEGREELRFRELEVGERDRKEEIFRVVRNVFQKIDVEKAIKQVYITPEDLFDWIYENAPYQLRNPEDLFRAMTALSEANIYLKRSWVDRMSRKYFYNLMTLGASLSGRGVGGPIWNPKKRRWALLAKTRTSREARRRVGRSIGRKCHVSGQKALREFEPFIRFIFKNNERMAVGLAKWLNLDTESVYYLKS